MCKVIDNNGKQMFANDNFKTCVGWAKNTKKPNKEWIYVVNNEGQAVLKF